MCPVNITCCWLLCFASCCWRLKAFYFWLHSLYIVLKMHNHWSQAFCTDSAHAHPHEAPCSTVKTGEATEWRSSEQPDWISTTTVQHLQRKWCPPETHVCLDLELYIKAKLFSAGGCWKGNYRNQRFFCHLPFKSDITECDHIYVENKQSKKFIHLSIDLPTHPSSTHLSNPPIHPIPPSTHSSNPSNHPTHSSIHPSLQCS